MKTRFASGQTLQRLLLPIIFLGLGLLFFASSAFAASSTLQTTATPVVTIAITPTFDRTRLDAPPINDPPRQVDNGAIYYWGVCMACHGDKGQGLTDEWRVDAFWEDANCWSSKCHGPNHPEHGFEMPKDSLAPALAGPGALTRFSNSYELYEYIYETMPWWNPGSISQQEAWAVTNYILKLNGTQVDNLVLTTTNAHAIPVQNAVTLPEAAPSGVFILIATMALAAIGIILQAFPESTKATISPPKPNFFHHLHPPSIPAQQSRFRYTLGAGGISVFFSLVLLVTGILEMFFYIPTPEQAATSVEVITTLVPFGNLIRNLHYWSAQLLLVAITIHLLRVILTGAYAKPRRLNFLIGLALLIFIILLDFTGYILRWDEGIRWALVVGTNLLKTIPGIGEGLYALLMGGTKAGPASLTRFYAWHIFGLTIGVAILTVWHAFRVRRDGGIAAPPPKERESKMRISRFELVRREVLAMVIAGIVLLLISAFIPAPIDQPITSTSISSPDSRAPWFFLWVQQLLQYGDPFIWGVLAPALVVLVLGLIPFILPRAKTEELGRWFPRGNKIAQILTLMIVAAIIVLTIIANLPTNF